MVTVPSSSWDLNRHLFFRPCTNIGVICGMWSQKPIEAWWPTLLLHLSQPMPLTDSRLLGKWKWKESKKIMSDKCSPYSSRLKNWCRKTKSCKLKWLRGTTQRSAIPPLNRPFIDRIVAIWNAYPSDTPSRLNKWMKRTCPPSILLCGLS